MFEKEREMFEKEREMVESVMFIFMGHFRRCRKYKLLCGHFIVSFVRRFKQKSGNFLQMFRHCNFAIKMRKYAFEFYDSIVI